MVQILPPVERRKSFSEKLSQGVGRGLEQALQIAKENAAQKAQQQQSERLSQLVGYDVSQLDPEMQKLAFSEALKGQYRQPPGGLTGQSVPPEINQAMSGIIQQFPNATSDELKLLLDEVGVPPIYSNSLIENRRRQQEREQDRELAEQKFAQQKFESERTFHTKQAEKQQEKVDALRESVPRKEMALNFARDAIESGDMSYFSPDKLADVTGIDLFRTAKGAQLLTAGKENLLSNMSRISARGTNKWMEQRLNSVFPKIGQSKEANLTVQEMLEGEVALDQAYMNSFDKISEEDMNKYGYVKKDISKRAYEDIKPIEKQIGDRTAYRMKQIEEEEKGFTNLKKQVGKNVPKGTPLTLQMAKLYKDKFGENAIKVAEKNGYRIPSVEEFEYYQNPLGYE